MESCFRAGVPGLLVRLLSCLNPFGYIPRGLPRDNWKGYDTPLLAAGEFISERGCLVREERGKPARLVVACIALLVLCILPTRSFSQQFPNRPVNLLMAIGTGGTADTSARMLANSVAKLLGQQVVISNNGGGGGSVALTLLKNEKPDGYHIVGTANQPLTIIPHQRQLPYTLNDFAPVIELSTQPAGVVINADSPWKTLKELIEYARKNPGKVTYTITGAYNIPHLAMMQIAQQEGVHWTAIPVSGDPNMPLLGGHVAAYSGATSWATNVRAGKFRLLAVYSEKRIKSFPDVPTLRELGYDFVGGYSSYIMAPKGTPAAILKSLENAFAKAMEEPEFVQYSRRMEVDLTARSSEEARTVLEAEYNQYDTLYKKLKIPKEGETK
jgi:tripartite-type tricarboxylate transporter receptor subunit TctC